MADSILEQARRVLGGFDELRLAYLFGSEARAEAGEVSDVDIAVLADRPLTLETDGRIRDALTAALHRHVDLVDLATAPPLLLRKVIGDGRVLICRNETERAKFETRAIARFLDTRRLRDIQYMYLRKLGETRRAG